MSKNPNHDEFLTTPTVPKKLNPVTHSTAVLPPPPQMPSRVAAAPRSGALPHSMEETIPVLESAPNSGDLDQRALQSALERQQQQDSVVAQAAPFSPRPPAPPLLVPQQQQQQPSRMSSLNMPVLHPPHAATVPPTPPTTPFQSRPTIAPLPPPPNVTAPFRRTPAALVSTAVNAATTAAVTPPTTTTSMPPVPTVATMEKQQSQESTTPAALPEPQPLPPLTFMPPSSSSSSSSSTSAANSNALARRQMALTVLVVATEQAHKMAHKSGLLLTDLLQGLAHVQSSAGSGLVASSLPPVRSIQKSVTLTHVPLHFVAASGPTPCQPVSNETAQTLLSQHAALLPADGDVARELDLLEDQVDNLLQDSSSSSRKNGAPPSMQDGDGEHGGGLTQVVKDAYNLTSPLSLPWLVRYRQILDVTTACAPCDYCSTAPVLVLLVATTREIQKPVDTLRSLQSPHYLPAPYQPSTGPLLDASTIRHEALVLHDHVDGPKDWDETALQQQLRMNFGSGATVLRLNSISSETALQLAKEEQNDLWQGGGRLGNCLSVSDRARLRQYLQQLTVSAVLPALERRIADLNVIVSERKKGVRNVLKSFWRSSNPDEKATSSSALTTNANSKKTYRYDRVESQTRLLGDSLFLIQDYEAALNTYRLCKDDFKHDKAHLHYANIQEMMALCLMQLDSYGRAREIVSLVENALLFYSRAAQEDDLPKTSSGRALIAPLATRLATRLCLVLVATRHLTAGRHLEVADLLASASSNETALGAAVLLEQASAHYYKADMHRKYAFHMLMAGHMFRAADQEAHAFRCFVSGLHLYRHAAWDELHNHVLSALAAQLYSMGRMAISLQLYAKLVGATDGGRVSVKSQQKFVNHLLEIGNEHFKKALAGADRMAAPAHLNGAQRDKVRKERLQRIVQVVRYTKAASRVLEIPNMELPGVDDTSVTVLAEQDAAAAAAGVASSSSSHGSGAAAFGKPGRGEDRVWEGLMREATAELQASSLGHDSGTDRNNTNNNTPMVNKALNQIADSAVRHVVAHMDQQKAAQALVERSKRSARYKPTPPVRARREPVVVEFVLRNSLGVPIDVSDVQLVARMTTTTSETTVTTVCTNQDAIQITPLVSFDKAPKWTFHSSDETFETADFCRISTGGEKDAWKSALEVEPFFVVTKQDCSLDPESRKTVTASICPLAQGDLEILGIRFRLFDDIWVFHPFTIKGELLQNTRENRANRVRGESLLLKAKVERGMPCLSAELIRRNSRASEPTASVTESPPVLQGQISEWTLRMANVGTAPAANVALKTNFPWVRIVAKGNDGDSIDEKAATSCCVGPTATLMKLFLNNSEDNNPLKNPGRIEPGEHVEIPIEIRTSGAGKQDFYMLFRYELDTDDNDDDVKSTEAPRHRWLKKMFQVPVYPSLSMAASIVPTFQTRGEYILSVELTNYRSDRPDNLQVVLEKMSLASRCYQLVPIPGQLPTSRQGSTISRTELGWQERMTVHYRVIHLDPSSSKSGLISQCSLSPLEATGETKSDDNHDDDGRNPLSLLSFLCLERAHQEFGETLVSHQMALARAAAAAAHGEGDHPRSISQIRRANTTLTTGGSEGIGNAAQAKRPHATSLARLCPLLKAEEFLHLICTWSTTGADAVHGEHHIHALQVRGHPPSHGGCPITVKANHPSHMRHDFTQGPATVPLQVHLRNELTAASTGMDDLVALNFCLEESESWDWCGPCKFPTRLASGQEMAIPVQAIIPRTGVYNLQKVRLVVDHNSGERVSYLFPLQWMVTVTQSV